MQKYSEGTRSSSIIPKALRCDASKVTLFEKLGEGAFAQVFRAEIDFGSRNGGKKPVAFKQMKESAMKQANKRRNTARRKAARKAKLRKSRLRNASALKKKRNGRLSST